MMHLEKLHRDYYKQLLHQIYANVLYLLLGRRYAITRMGPI